MSAVYHGHLGLATFKALVPQVLGATRNATVVVIRMDGSVTTMARMPEVPEDYKGCAPEGCVIVRRDQFALWSGYAEKLSQQGVRRVVFLDSQLGAALRWVQRRSLLRALPAL